MDMKLYLYKSHTWLSADLIRHEIPRFVLNEDAIGRTWVRIESRSDIRFQSIIVGIIVLSAELTRVYREAASRFVIVSVSVHSPPDWIGITSSS